MEIKKINANLLRTVKAALLLFFILFIVSIPIFIVRFEKCQYPNLIGSYANLALSKNGAAAIHYSTEYAPGWEAMNLIDGNYATGWGTRSDAAAGEWVELILPGTKPTTIKEIRINPGPTIGIVSSWGLKDFHIDISTDEAKYTTILRGSFTLNELNKTKSFSVNPVSARFIRIIVESNQDPELSRYGDVAELEVYSCDIKTSIGKYLQKKYPRVISALSSLSENTSYLFKSITRQDVARTKIPTTTLPTIGKYFRLFQETVVRANDALRYPPYPKHLSVGTIVKISDGPRYSDGYEWWKLSEEEWGGYTGWFALKQYDLLLK